MNVRTCCSNGYKVINAVRAPLRLFIEQALFFAKIKSGVYNRIMIEWLHNLALVLRLYLFRKVRKVLDKDVVHGT